MENFELNKGQTIRNVFEQPFCKVILIYLVVNEDFILEPDLVKLHIDRIMEGWTRKHMVVNDYVFNDVFLNVIHSIEMNEFLGVVLNLSDNKAVSLSGITNELSVVENALEKNCKLWLVLQDIRKTYNLVDWKHLKKSLVRIKMCSKFIKFFGSIHNGHLNRVITNFGLTNSYSVYDGLDQGKVFLHLLWHIFYDTLLCKVKRQKAVYDYRLNLYYVAKTGHIDLQNSLTFFLAVGAFVDDTIWVGSSQVATQHIFNVASEFFRMNDISINNNKTVVIPINCRVAALFLSKTFKQWKRLDPHGLVSVWFVIAIWHLHDSGSLDASSSLLDEAAAKNILESYEFRLVPNWLSGIGASGFFVYTDGFFCGLGSVNIKAGAAVFFEDINLGLGMEVSGMVSSILVELQAIALALECVPNSSSVHLFSDSQAALDASLHHKLPIVVCKHLYDKYYLSVMCLYCGDVKVLDHVFSCAFDVAA
ncbi:hypothetical protein G9A89_012293 [Geosiphon pyriformis]|nr:hypothetical protein G9A89_012293 [Geosiphon pyriformis]